MEGHEMICAQCETVTHCSSNGCIPITVEDAPVSTPEQTMTWPKRALQFAFGVVLAGALFALVRLNWPLFVIFTAH
jgi:hypothetical protein